MPVIGLISVDNIIGSWILPLPYLIVENQMCQPDLPERVNSYGDILVNEVPGPYNQVLGYLDVDATGFGI